MVELVMIWIFDD